MKDLGFRNTWISLGVGLSLFGIVGLAFLSEADEARAFFGLLCLMVTVVLRQTLDGRELRRREHAKPPR